VGISRSIGKNDTTPNMQGLQVFDYFQPASLKKGEPFQESSHEKRPFGIPRKTQP
jgi:hypothetical protein